MTCDGRVRNIDSTVQKEMLQREGERRYSKEMPRKKKLCERKMKKVTDVINKRERRKKPNNKKQREKVLHYVQRPKHV